MRKRLDESAWISRVLAWTRQKQIAFPFGVFIFARVWTLFWASLSLILIPLQAAGAYHGMKPLKDWLWSPWQRWDAVWYTLIAEQGYHSNSLSVAFFPLYPILIRVLTIVLPLNSIAAGLLVSSVAALIAFVLFYSFAEAEFGLPVAQLGLLYLAFFPTAFFLLAPYTESLFLVLALAALLVARSGRWELAGVFGGLAALTRPQGVLLALPLLIEFFLQYRRKAVGWAHVANLLVVIAGGLAFWIYLIIEFHNPMIWFQAQAYWHQSAMPWESLYRAASVLLNARDPVRIAYAFPDFAMVFLFLGLSVWSSFRLGITFAAYMAIVILPPLFSPTTFAPLLPLASFSRYAVVAFPGMILLALIPAQARWHKLAIALALVCQTIWLILFSHWIFVG
jgi:hypothetical protein